MCPESCRYDTWSIRDAPNDKSQRCSYPMPESLSLLPWIESARRVVQGGTGAFPAAVSRHPIAKRFPLHLSGAFHVRLCLGLSETKTSSKFVRVSNVRAVGQYKSIHSVDTEPVRCRRRGPAATFTTMGAHVQSTGCKGHHRTASPKLQVLQGWISEISVVLEELYPSLEK